MERLPSSLQDVDSCALNGWAIAAYNNVLWRGEELMDLLPERGWLRDVAIVGTTLALLVSRSGLQS